MGRKAECFGDASCDNKRAWGPALGHAPWPRLKGRQSMVSAANGRRQPPGGGMASTTTHCAQTSSARDPPNRRVPVQAPATCPRSGLRATPPVAGSNYLSEGGSCGRLCLAPLPFASPAPSQEFITGALASAAATSDSTAASTKPSRPTALCREPGPAWPGRARGRLGLRQLGAPPHLGRARRQAAWKAAVRGGARCNRAPAQLPAPKARRRCWR